MVILAAASSAFAQTGGATGAGGMAGSGAATGAAGAGHPGSVMVPRTGGTSVPTPIAGANAGPGANTGAQTVPQTGPALVPGPGASSSPFPFQTDTAAPHFTLMQALAAMAHSHPVLQAAQANIDAARHDVTAAGLWTNPQLNINYSHSIIQPVFSPSPGMPTCTASMTNCTASAYDPSGYISGGFSQLIELANLPGARRHEAEYTLEATRNDGEATRRGLIFDVYTAFVTLTATQARLEILRDTASQMEHASQIVTARFRAGANADYDVRRITIALADARAAVADAEADLTAARGDFDVAVGPYAGQLVGSPMFDLYDLPPMAQLTSLIDQMHRRPDVLAARHRAQAAGAGIDVARRSVFQGVTVFVGAGYGSTQPPPNFVGHEIDGTLGVTLPLPFVDRGQGTIPAAEYRAQAAAFTANALQLAGEQRISAGYNEVVRRRQALVAYRDAGVAQSADMRREAEARYAANVFSVLELVDAYNSYRDALLRLVSLALDARTSEVSLGRATGMVPP